MGMVGQQVAQVKRDRTNQDPNHTQKSTTQHGGPDHRARYELMNVGEHHVVDELS